MLTCAMPQLSLAAQFPREDQAVRAYHFVTRDLTKGNPQLSVFRFEDGGHYYLAVVGEEANMRLWEALARRLTREGGQIIALDDATIDGLFARRSTPLPPHSSEV